MSNLIQHYRDYCESKGIPFQLDTHVRPYDDSTLFCPAGMQQFKNQFLDQEVKGKTIANIQSCIRLNDYDEVGDGTHLLYFNMIGLFSFRQLSIQEAIDFWMGFIQDKLKLTVDYVTIHPDKMEDWTKLYDSYNVEIRPDEECTWSDGTNKSSYCTEFYIQDVEVGNIVNPNGDCIDVGFGYERLETFLLLKLELENPEKSRVDLFKEAIEVISKSGYVPGPKQQGYILRKLLRDLVKFGGEFTEDDPPPLHDIYKNELVRQQNVLGKYERLKEKHSDKPAEWWYDTHGIDINLLPLDEVEVNLQI